MKAGGANISYNERFDQDGKKQHGWSVGMGAVSVNYDTQNGYGASVSLSLQGNYYDAHSTFSISQNQRGISNNVSFTAVSAKERAKREAESPTEACLGTCEGCALI